MDLNKALEVTGIKKEELSRIDKAALDAVIEIAKSDVKSFPYNTRYRDQLEAFNKIKEELNVQV